MDGWIDGWFDRSVAPKRPVETKVGERNDAHEGLNHATHSTLRRAKYCNHSAQAIFHTYFISTTDVWNVSQSLGLCTLNAPVLLVTLVAIFDYATQGGYF